MGVGEGNGGVFGVPHGGVFREGEVLGAVVAEVELDPSLARSGEDGRGVTRGDGLDRATLIIETVYQCFNRNETTKPHLILG